MGVCSLLIKNGFWGVSGFNFFDSFAHISLMLNTWGTQNEALRTLSLGDMTLVGRRDMDGESGKGCFRRCLNSFGYKRRQNLDGRSRWRKKKGLREGKRIGELARFWWVSTKCTAPTSSTEPIITFHRKLLFFLLMLFHTGISAWEKEQCPVNTMSSSW